MLLPIVLALETGPLFPGFIGNPAKYQVLLRGIVAGRLSETLGNSWPPRGFRCVPVPNMIDCVWEVYTTTAWVCFHFRLSIVRSALPIFCWPLRNGGWEKQTV